LLSLSCRVQLCNHAFKYQESQFCRGGIEIGVDQTFFRK
jgi:hypothetical protein